MLTDFMMHEPLHDRLAEILRHKEGEVARLLDSIPELRRAALKRDEFRGFKSALRPADGSIGLIAEIKRASPSAGVICADFDPLEIGMTYDRAGADAISTLTDERFFQGSLDHMKLVRSGTGCPVLRKDFTIHPVQIYEAAAAGADAVLLIVAALRRDLYLQLLDVAGECQLDVIVEVHTMQELDIALDSPAEIIGINNRNLRTFETDLATTEELATQVDDDLVVISESGLRTPDDVIRVWQAGVDAVLIGETLMRAGNVPGTIASFKACTRGTR
ncbi:MAG: indole-3-glycerol phosphate synthase TrpC [Verrucomicrobiia bacterium]